MKYIIKKQSFLSERKFTKTFENLLKKGDYAVIRDIDDDSIYLIDSFNGMIEPVGSIIVWVKTILPRKTTLWEFDEEEYEILYSSRDLEKAKEKYELYISTKKYNL